MDLFAVPLGYVDPDQGPEDELSISPIPSEAFDHRGKWVALRRRSVVAIHDSEAQLYADPVMRQPQVTPFHVPASRIIAR